MHRTPMPSVAAPAVAQEARPPRPTNDTAPVTPRQGAAIERARAHQLSGAAASGAGIAGMAGPAGPARPEVTADGARRCATPRHGHVRCNRLLRCRRHLRRRHDADRQRRAWRDLFADRDLSSPPLREGLIVSKQRSQFDEIGQWSEIKLEIIREYAHAYSTILTKKNFRHYYIDGFAGAGVHISKATGQWVLGSPLNALMVTPPFRHHFLIDLDGGRVQGLAEIVGGRSDVTLLQGDCNRVLLNDVFPRVRYELYERAMCLLDPYGLQLTWQVLESAGKSRTIDLFLNFPIMDINRRALWTEADRVSAEQAAPMTTLWGDDSWKSVAYRPSAQGSLFGPAEVEKAPNDAIVEAFRKRLRTKVGFEYVPQPMPMRNSTNAVIYYLFFASHQSVASDIIESIFRKYGATRTRPKRA
jgi:three-Cys-motif partner protein